VLLRSTPRAWLSDSPDIMPRLDESATPGATERRVQDLGVVMQGRFESWFARREVPLLPEQPGVGAPTQQVPLLRSPESSRIVLFASNDFMDDQVLSSVVSATGTQYLGPLELFMNTLDWALQDDALLAIRSRGHFNRTLPPMERRAQVLIEYFNYGLSLLWLGLLAVIAIANRWLRRRRYARSLTL
jgi:ABC-2 type transport system permease protein